MKTPATTIPKDLVNELKRLAIAAVADEDSFEKAHDRFVTAGKRLSTSASEFAVTLYTFAQQYASQPALIDAKLLELRITYKSPSVYHRIVRLAVDDVPNKDKDAVRMQISRYGRLIERAHTKGISTEEFRKGVNKSITATLKSLGAIPADKKKAIALGRAEASKLMANMTFPLTGFAAPHPMNEGDEVELVARYENGQLVIFGMIPPSIAEAGSSLVKLGKSLLPTSKRPLALLPDILRTLKLVSNAKDNSLLATYKVDKSFVHLTVAGKKAVAVLSAPIELDFLSKKTITLTVQEWGQLCSTLIPITKEIESVAFDGKVLVATVDDALIPNIGKWMEKKGKVIAIATAEAVDNELQIALASRKGGTSVVGGSAWKNSVAFTESDLRPLLSFKPSKAVAAFQLKPGQVSVKSAASDVTGHVNLKGPQLKILKTISSKLFRLALGPVPEVTIDQTDGYLRVSAIADKGKLYAVMIEVA